MRLLALALLLTGCSAKKPVNSHPGMHIIGNYTCLIEATDKYGKPSLMTCDDGKGERRTWRAE